MSLNPSLDHIKKKNIPRLGRPPGGKNNHFPNPLLSWFSNLIQPYLVTRNQFWAQPILTATYLPTSRSILRFGRPMGCKNDHFTNPLLFLFFNLIQPYLVTKNHFWSQPILTAPYSPTRSSAVRANPGCKNDHFPTQLLSWFSGLNLSLQPFIFPQVGRFRG